MSDKPFILNIVWDTEEDMLTFFRDAFRDHRREMGVFPAESLDLERRQGVQQYVLRDVPSIRGEALAVAGGDNPLTWSDEYESFVRMERNA